MMKRDTLRVIDAREISSIAGGTEDTDEIVVVGSRRESSIDAYDFVQFRNAFDASMFGSGFGGLMGGGGGTATPAPDDWNPDGDDDGDGIPNSEEEIVVTADLNDVRELQALAALAERQATGIMFALTVWLGAERATADAAMAFLVRIFGSERVAGAVAAGAGFAAGEVTHSTLTNLLTQIHFNDWESDGRNIEMPQRGDWDYVGDPRGWG